jgi:glycosyltransferase involved in cell wall biosynthesis
MVASSGGAVVRYGDSAGAAGDIARLIVDRKLRRQVGAAGRAFVEAGFLLDRAADQTVALYQELADGTGGRERG